MISSINRWTIVTTFLEMAEKEPSAKKSNFGGWQSRDNIHETEGIFREFTSSLNKIANGVLCE
jgi:fumarate hydratase class II